MALIQKIPLLPDTTDQFVSIELGGNPYIIRVLWNERFGYFSLSIFTADNVPILINIKMVKNYPLTQRFKDELLPFGFLAFVQEKGKSDRPSYDDLAITHNLYYIEPDIEITAQPVRQAVAEPSLGTIWDSGLTTWDDGDTTWDM